MFAIRTYNAISPTGLARFDGARYTVSSEAPNPAGVLLRSYKLTTDELPASVAAVARAGAGTNNVPTTELTGRGWLCLTRQELTPMRSRN